MKRYLYIFGIISIIFLSNYISTISLESRNKVESKSKLKNLVKLQSKNKVGEELEKGKYSYSSCGSSGYKCRRNRCRRPYYNSCNDYCWDGCGNYPYTYPYNNGGCGCRNYCGYGYGGYPYYNRGCGCNDCYSFTSKNPGNKPKTCKQ